LEILILHHSSRLPPEGKEHSSPLWGWLKVGFSLRAVGWGPDSLLSGDLPAVRRIEKVLAHLLGVKCFIDYTVALEFFKGPCQSLRAVIP